MNLVLLLPACIALFLVLRGRAQTAFIAVYLPTLLLTPEDYSVRLPHLPALSAAEFSLIPVGVAGLFKLIRSRSFVLMDFLMATYVGSLFATEVLRERIVNDGIFFAFSSSVSIFFAYMVGRQLIEPNLRLATIKRMVLLFILTIPFGLFEWRFSQNLYGIIGQKILFLSSINTGAQLRGGHGRLGAAFTASELAGIAFGMTACLNAWLVYLNKANGESTLGKNLAKLEKYHIPGILLLFSIFLTQSRGPMLSIAASYLILQIPRFKNTALATAVVALIFVVGTFAASAYFNRYTNVSDEAVVSEQQGSALYRREMNEYYKPLAEEGGWLGWAAFGVPSVGGKVSIDNEYLRVHLVQGRLGYLVLILITADSIRVLLVRSWRLKALEDRAFVFSMLGAMTILWITLYTVFMGQQLPQFAFLFIGWCQSIVPGSIYSETEASATATPKFVFRRVLQ